LTSRGAGVRRPNADEEKLDKKEAIERLKEDRLLHRAAS